MPRPRCTTWLHAWSVDGQDYHQVATMLRAIACCCCTKAHSLHLGLLWGMKQTPATSRILNELIGDRSHTMFCALRLLFTMH